MSSSSASGLPGVQLAVGNDLTVEGVTSDGYVIYYDHAHSSVNAVPITGGTPQVISAAAGTNFGIYTDYEVVLVWTNLNASNVGGLVSWSAADGAHTLATASQSGYAAVDSSSRYIVYTTNVNAAVTPVSLDVVGSLTDGTSAVTLVTGAQTTTSIYFDIFGTRAVVNYANATGATNYQFATYPIGQWTTTAFTSTDSLIVESVDAAGTEVLVIDDTTNTLEVFPIAGGAAKPIAGSLLLSSTLGQPAMLTPDGKTAIFAGSSGATLDRSPLVTPATTVIANGASLSVDLISPNSDTLVAYGGATPSVFFGSATNLGALTNLCPSADFGGAFYTNDSSHLLYVPNYNIAGSGVGPLTSFAVAGGTSKVIDPAINLLAVTGTSQVVFSDNATPTTNDVKVADTATAAAPTLIVAQAQPAWAVAPKAGVSSLVYSWNVDLGATAGIYVAPLP
jgi:hypothetical protein